MTDAEKGYTALNTEIGKSLKNLRKSRKLTQEEMANILGTHVNTVSKIENGKINISAAYLYVYAACFKVTIDSIVGGRTDNIRPDLASLIGESLNGEQQDMLIRLISTYLGI